MCLCSPSSINWYRLRLGVKWSGVGYAGSHFADLTVCSQLAPLQHRSYLWLPLYIEPCATPVAPPPPDFLGRRRHQQFGIGAPNAAAADNLWSPPA